MSKYGSPEWKAAMAEIAAVSEQTQREYEQEEADRAAAQIASRLVDGHVLGLEFLADGRKYKFALVDEDGREVDVQRWI